MDLDPGADPEPGDREHPAQRGLGRGLRLDFLRYVYDASVSFCGERANSPLVVWLDMGVERNCGACMGPSRYADLGGVVYERQIWLPGGPDETYWSGAVVAHELGHYVMATYGVWPGEGGKHVFGVPSHRGLAWSDGVASPVYFDKQQGTFFWSDIAQRRYSQTTWKRPTANGGLELLIDENEVAAMLPG